MILNALKQLCVHLSKRIYWVMAIDQLSNLFSSPTASVFGESPLSQNLRCSGGFKNNLIENPSYFFDLFAQGLQETFTRNSSVPLLVAALASRTTRFEYTELRLEDHDRLRRAVNYCCKNTSVLASPPILPFLVLEIVSKLPSSPRLPSVQISGSSSLELLRLALANLSFFSLTSIFCSPPFFPLVLAILHQLSVCLLHIQQQVYIKYNRATKGRFWHVLAVMTTLVGVCQSDSEQDLQTAKHLLEQVLTAISLNPCKEQGFI